MRQLAVLLVLLAASDELRAQDPLLGQLPQGSATNERLVSAARLEESERIELDGRLDETAWRRAAPATDFLQSDPVNGAAATERTEVRVLFDRHHVYLGVICFDSEPHRLLGNQMQRDQPFSGDDRFMWSIDTYLDGRSGYFFEINPSGAMGDGLIVPGRNDNISVNKSWDGIWTARVRRSDIGWTAEVEIPFRTLNFARNAAAWGINFQRTVRRKNEESRWSGHARNQGLTRMASAGQLVGLSGASQGVGLDLKPYLVADVSQAPGLGAPALVGSVTGGGDLFYNLTPGLRANFTLNTDFAETEVDQRRVNLTRFPLFFPEKRDFFLEGSSFFDFSREPGEAVVPFFSRRIGLDAAGQPQRIDYGVKLTGQLGSFDLGLLQVKTGDTDTLEGEAFTVVRSRRRVLAQSYFGTIYTRRGGPPGEEDRHTAGVDFEIATSRFRGSQNLELSGFYLFTSNLSDTGRGNGYGVRLSYPNDLWNARISFRELQEHYDPAVGFTERRGYRRLNPVVQFSPRPKTHPWIRRVSLGVNAEILTDVKNHLLTRRPQITALEVELHTGDRLEVEVVPFYERLEEDFEISSGIILPAGGRYNFTRYSVQLDTADRRTVALESQYDFGTFYSGNRREASVGVTVRPRPGWLISVDGEHNELDLAEGRFATNVFRALVNTQFNPWISLTNNVQYDTVTKIAGWQFRFRWITQPGNDVYVVYTHNWIDRQTVATFDRKGAIKVIRTYRF